MISMNLGLKHLVMKEIPTRRPRESGDPDNKIKSYSFQRIQKGFFINYWIPNLVWDDGRGLRAGCVF